MIFGSKEKSWNARIMNSEVCFWCKTSKWVQKTSKVHFLSLFFKKFWFWCKNAWGKEFLHLYVVKIKYPECLGYILKMHTSEKQTIQIHRSQGTVVVCYKMWGHKIPLSKWIWTQCTCWCESTSFLILSHCVTWSSVCMLHETIKKIVFKKCKS